MATVTMELTPAMEEQMIDTFEIEVEIMQGSREEMPDGRSRIKIEVNGEKEAMLKDYVLMLMKMDQMSINQNQN